MPRDISEEEIKEALEAKFGPVSRVRIPFDSKDEHLEEHLRRRRPIAFITFLKEESASRALAAREIVIDISVLNLEPSMKRVGQMRERRDREGFGGAGGGGEDAFKMLRK